MNRLKPHRKNLARLLGAMVLAPLASAPQAGEGESCAALSHAAQAARSGGVAKSADCTGYGQCMDLGRRLLREGAPGDAALAFENALRAPDAPPQGGLGEAYACAGVGYEASGDRIQAQSYLEKARGVSGRKLAWVEEEYKALLSSQTTLAADEIQRKLEADRKVAALAAPAAGEGGFIRPGPPAETVASGEGEEDERGFKPVEVPNVAMNEPEPYPQSKAAGGASGKKTAAAQHRHARKPGARPPGRKPAPAAAQAPAYSGPSLDLRINFEFGSAELTPEGRAQADELGKALEKILSDGRQLAVLVGHTDLVGKREENHQLSEERAASVGRYLSQSFPSLAGKLSEKGMGMGQPLYREMDEETQRLNRRVEVQLIQTSQ